MSFTKELISKTVANFDNGVKDSLNMVDHGLIVDTRYSLYPLSKHRSERIFSLDALMKFFVEENRIDYTTQVLRDQTEANSASELFKKFETKVSASGSGKAIGVSFSATAAAEYSYTRNTKENVRFAQLKLVCEVATIDMPEGTELRALLEPSFLKALDNVSTRAEAANLVERFGAVYISDATWGGSLSLTTSSQTTETTSSTNLLASLEAEMKGITNSGSVSVSASNEETTSNIQENFKYTMVGIGGIPNLVNDEAAWMESVGVSPAVVEIKVSSIAELALPGSKAREYLAEAVIEHSAQYESLLEDDLYLKSVAHKMRFHWKMSDLQEELDNHKIFCETRMKGKFPFKMLKEYLASVKKGLQYVSFFEGIIAKGYKVESFLMSVVKQQKINKELIDQSTSFVKDMYKEHFYFIKRLTAIIKPVGTLGLSGTTVSFHNERHGRFLQLDPLSKMLIVGKVSDANVLEDPEISEFKVKVVDKSRGHVALYHTESDTYLTTKGDNISCETFDDSQNLFPTGLKFTFFAHTSGFTIQSISTGMFISVDANSFHVVLSDIEDSGSKFLIKGSA